LLCGYMRFANFCLSYSECPQGVQVFPFI